MSFNTKLRSRLWRITLKMKGKSWIVDAGDDELSDAVSTWYEFATGKRIDIDNPQTFNEKIQWLKARDRDVRKSDYSDKVAVRNIVAEKIGENVLLEHYAVWDRASQMSFEGISRPFMLKANNASGAMLLVDERTVVDEARAKADEWLTNEYALVAIERQYSLIAPKVFAEEYLCDIVFEYQAWCFNGKAAFVAAIVEPHGVNKKQFFTREWEREPFVSSKPIYEGEIQRPECLEDVLAFSERLAQGFTHVRVDWYWSESRGLKFSEMTFTPAAGAINWHPAEYDEKLGYLIELPIVD